MYRMVRVILCYNMYHTICTLYCMIHEHLRYIDIIRNFYTRYDMYCTILTTIGVRVKKRSCLERRRKRRSKEVAPNCHTLA